MGGSGRRTKKSMIVRSRRSPLVRNDPSGGYNYQNKGQGRVLQHNPQVASIVASRITSSDKGTARFLKNIPVVQMQRDIIRKLVLRRTGVLPGKPQPCQNCEGSPQATRDHIVVCSGLKRDSEAFIQPAQEGEHNILDAALSSGKIWRIPEVWTKSKRDSRRYGVSAWVGCGTQVREKFKG